MSSISEEWSVLILLWISSKDEFLINVSLLVSLFIFSFYFIASLVKLLSSFANDDSSAIIFKFL